MGGDGRPVIIYLHGNVGTRWDESSRTETLELILMDGADNHVLSLDYRGFGDSTGEPSESGMTSDTFYLYQWVKKRSRGGHVYLWGHSLGSAVDALILEAPYTTIREVVALHPLAKVRPILMKTISDCGYIFYPLRSLKALTSPLLILHAEDDNIVPYHMGLKLYQISLQAKKKYNTDVRVEMISYSANLGFSHSSIYLDPNLSNVVR
uniref:AB hydrolase-1 domain-containing protein n=1 Tax=Dicentrarchus labrax TaxID=13489 RepID=A0A8C4NZ89_DICLA